MMNILISPNAFKNSIDAEAAADSIKEGLLQSRLNCNCECFPIADGGDGTGNLIIEKLGGLLVEMETNDPLGRKIKTSFGIIDQGNTAIIEMAHASGLKLLSTDELNPLIATSYGTGEQIKMAIDKGVKKIVIGMGGSATIDGGCGILRALGCRFLDAQGDIIPFLPKDLTKLRSVDLSGVDPRISDCDITVLCDVDNKLLGEQGSAHVFGPQKGATPQMVVKLNECLKILSEVSFRHTGRNMSNIRYGGTAGGAAAGLYALLGAKLTNGIEYFLDLTGFNNSLDKCDLLITGEGSLDKQTLQGKGPFGVAQRAKKKGIPVIGLAGMVPLHSDENIHQFFDVLMPISHEPMNIENAIQYTSENLKRTALEIGNTLAILSGKME